jgi:hypothetical protein
MGKPKSVKLDNKVIQAGLAQVSAQDLVTERLHQLDQWSYEHDDAHSMEDWAYFINERTEALSLGLSSKKARKTLIEIGALSLAALEAMNRKEARKK